MLKEDSIMIVDVAGILDIQDKEHQGTISSPRGKSASRKTLSPESSIKCCALCNNIFKYCWTMVKQLIFQFPQSVLIGHASYGNEIYSGCFNFESKKENCLLNKLISNHAIWGKCFCRATNRYCKQHRYPYV